MTWTSEKTLSVSLLKEWNFNRNTISTDTITPNSGKKVWWKCELEHEWEATVYSRTAGRGCPVCAGKRIVVGFNDLASQRPELAQQWSTKNDTSPTEYTVGSGKKVWWVCANDHEWEATIDNRVKGRGCPACAGKRIVVGFNDLASQRPELAQQWSTKNGLLLPTDVGVNSNRKVWWICAKDHEWETTVVSRSAGKNCPVCAGNSVLPGFNDLETLFPSVAAEWHLLKNVITARQITAFTKQKVWWLGKCGHEWEASILNRTRAGTGCPYCSGRLPVGGITDLFTTHPELLKQFHSARNKGIDISSLSRGSDVKVWWICENSHEWEAVVYSRTSKHKTGCPLCAQLSFSSTAEQAVQDFIVSLTSLEVVLNTKNIISPYELDIYIPEKKIAVEFNGIYWHDENHKRKTYHYDKWLACKNQGIQLIQIWEDDWNRNPELVKQMLAHKLGLSVMKRKYAREMQVRDLSREESNTFLERTHIQGVAEGSIRVGLVDKSSPSEVSAVMVLKKEPGTGGKVLNLVRFSTSLQVVGGFSKLLTHVKRVFEPVAIVTFSDNCLSDGGLYKNNGFTAVKELSPDYMYVVNKHREHKFGYRLERFKNDPDLVYKVKLSERQLALLNKLPRIWDAGKIKWEIRFDDTLNRKIDINI